MSTNKNIIEEAIKQHSLAIRKEIPTRVKLYYFPSEEALHYVAYESNNVLKSRYDNLAFTKVLLTTFYPQLANMSPQDFEDTLKSFTYNEEIKDIETGVYKR